MVREEENALKPRLTISFWSSLEKCVELVLKLEKCVDALLNIVFWSTLEKCVDVVLKLEKCVDAILNCIFFGEMGEMRRKPSDLEVCEINK